MKVYLSFDFEGVAGIVDWEQCREGGAGYELGCRLMLGEVNAAIEGAVAGGADEIVLNDSHSTMRNLDPDSLAHGVSYVSGRHKQLYMMQELDDSYDVIFFIGYHGSISGPTSTLSHTYNPEVFSAARVNGVEVGESGINALVADHFGVPIGLVTGDSVTQQQTAPFARNAVQVVTKRSDSRFSAKNLHPAESRRRIQAGGRGERASSRRRRARRARTRTSDPARPRRADRRHGRGGQLGQGRRASRHPNHPDRVGRCSGRLQVLRRRQLHHPPSRRPLKGNWP